MRDDPSGAGDCVLFRSYLEPEPSAVDEAAKGAKADARRLAEWVKAKKVKKARGDIIFHAVENFEDCDGERAKKLLDIAARQGWLIGTPESDYEANV
ncbi:hypothetical protein [Halogeometricum luteum]|uniref:Amphi-Trp domain-containing protein n=1 Tax=Halogeometricum luteum TaxID=2950537 RepID=A0ABU2G8V7_9EURY|nr:hypothetical protein [Halogeometricum sp. S3BR5-2]MDS0296558.1 hypothetical protein [Halogeometricum sp. S3BR5-2]